MPLPALGRLLSFLRPTDRRTGFVYAADSDDTPMRGALRGQIVRVKGSGPPYIVVDKTAAGVMVARWPGKLWQVRIVEAAKPEDQPLPYANYIRALAVEIIAEANLAGLFGDHGNGVLRVLARATTLSRSEAEQLATSLHADAPAAYNRVFRRWATAQGKTFADDDDSLDGVLFLLGIAEGSPVNHGLTVIHDLVFRIARACDGDAAYASDNEDDVYLVTPWSDAALALEGAALALGAPQFATDDDRTALLFAWTAVFGDGLI